MESVLIGTVLRRVPLENEDKGINLAWRATIRTKEGDISAIIKKIPDNEIIVEIACALLGRAIDLPIARPLIVNDAEYGVVFGSEDLEHPDLRHSLIPREIIYAFLSRWAELPKACVFDEWIANYDRNDGNILTNGLDFWLIDHGLALNVDLFKSNSAIDNMLLNKARRFADNDIKKQKLINNLNKAILIISPQLLDFSDSTVQIPDDIVSFLENRSLELKPLIMNKVRGQNEIFIT